MERLNVTRVLNLFSESILANLFSLPSHSGPPTQGGGRLSDFINQGASPGLMNFNSKLSLTILSCLMYPRAPVISSSPINQGSHKATLEFISRKQVVSSPETGFFCHFSCEEYPFPLVFLVERHTQASRLSFSLPEALLHQPFLQSHCLYLLSVL